MITSYPVPLTHTEPSRVAVRPLRDSEVKAPGSWRYDNRSRQRTLFIVAGVLSACVHVALLFGVKPQKKKAATSAEKPPMVLLLQMPKVEELEEPETVSNDNREVTDHATLVPMQADLPQLARPNEFIQQVNFTSLLEKPDLTNININVIPDTFRGGRKRAENIGKIFNLADLDRTPEPVLQQAPLYPIGLKRDGISGKVKVEFIVDADGKVLDPHAVEASHEGFVDAAVIAVSKWKFKPGVKAGRKVNTRMAVPILFSIEDQI